ncbi:SDR family NAD(P)-dependent oxidoreductase [Lactococcus fujiensis]|uniref:Carbonyl reductase n=2 Tax=Lactococcus fujiensis TaxID=610251 RepID=A0A2A5RK08_9LACT|nr:SDR family NAD(P)-dependent oxidoreductase [Lactococcus fujiensis]PCR99496.1 carbonyl reductase [Lactococcus fujiensis JCM 16395]
MVKALVTGANKGIGLEIARYLGHKGISVFIGARNEEKGQAAVQILRAEGLDAHFVKLDLNDFGSLHNVAKQVGRLDYLVNNAGIPGNLKSDKGQLDMSKSAFAYSTDDLRETLEVNFLGTHELILNLLSNLADDAKILNVTVPISGNQFWQPLAYITSKAAQNSMTMAFGNQFIKDKSKRQIFGVMPGAVATDLNGAQASRFVKKPEEAAQIISDFLFDGKNHNAKIVDERGKEIKSYEPNLSKIMGFASTFVRSFKK